MRRTWWLVGALSGIAVGCATESANIATATEGAESDADDGGNKKKKGGKKDDDDGGDDEAAADETGGDETGGDETGGDVVDGSTGPDPLAMTPVGIHGQLSVQGTVIVDQNGTPVQLKGPSSMWLNWEYTGFADSSLAVTYMRDNWNATVIRAAMGVEPDNAYLARPSQNEVFARRVIDNAIDLGMYVIIDWHAHDAHLSQDAAIEFFTKMATLYGDTPNVIYEPWNEPIQVDWSTQVKPYHEAVVAAIRAVDPNGIIILGTPNWSQHVDIASADPVVGTNLMYTLHFYSCTHTTNVQARAITALNNGAPLFVTEWGATHADGGTPTNPGLCLPEAQAWHDFMNQNMISWAAWKLDDCVDESCFFVEGTQPFGNWTPDQYNGHGTFVRDRMIE